MSDRLKRFYATLLFSNATKQSAWAGGFFLHPEEPTRNQLFELFKDDAAGGLQRRGFADTVPASLHVANLFELPEPPRPLAGDRRPLLNWKVTVDFVCHDVKFGYTTSGVFQWPERPPQAALDMMARVLMADALSSRGDGPDFADYSDVREMTVEPSDRKPDYPLE
jgi:hypothetical protein